MNSKNSKADGSTLRTFQKLSLMAAMAMKHVIVWALPVLLLIHIYASTLVDV